MYGDLEVMLHSILMYHIFLFRERIALNDALLLSKYVYESQLNASKWGVSVSVHCCCPLYCTPLSLSFTAFLLCLHGFLRLRAMTDADDEVLSIFPDVAYALDSRRRQSTSYSNMQTHRSPLNTVHGIASPHFPIIPRSSWRMINTLYGLSCLPDTLSISVSIFSLVAGWMRDLPLAISNAPKPLLVMHLFIQSNVRHYTVPPTQNQGPNVQKYHTSVPPPHSLKLSASCPCEDDVAYLQQWRGIKIDRSQKRMLKRCTSDKGAYSFLFPPTPAISQLNFFSSTLFHTSVLSHSYRPLH